MRPRAIKDLAQLTDSQLFATISEGLPLLLANSERLYDASEKLADEKAFQGARVLRNAAEEEAAKVLILFDAARCPRLPPCRFSRQLGRFNNHLSKALYAYSCFCKPSSFHQMQDYLDIERRDRLVDGCCGEVSFPNYQLWWRESALYVDFIEDEGRHSWSDAGSFLEDAEPVWKGMRPPALELGSCLISCGAGTAQSLRVIADLWRRLTIRPETSCSELQDWKGRTLGELHEQELLQEQPDKVWQTIMNDWQFPLYDLDLSLIPVDETIPLGYEEDCY